MTVDISDAIAIEHESMFSSESEDAERAQSSVITLSKLGDPLEDALRQYTANGCDSYRFSDFDFDVKYDPVKCVMSHRVPLITGAIGISIRKQDHDGTQDAPETAQETDATS